SDHAGAFGDPVYRYICLADFCCRGCDFRKRVRGHNRAGRREKIASLSASNEAFHHPFESLRLERFADHTCGSQKDILRFTASSTRGDLRSELAGVSSVLPGEGIGISGIDDEDARLSLFQMCAAPLDWC